MAGRVRAPELVGRGGWVGVGGPLSLAALRGKVVLVDFWTSCCVNCLRVLDELRPLEDRFADELVVVGVHSPKFPREADHDAVVAAVARHRVAHPVLDDPDLATWQRYGVTAWPTLVLVDPEGYVAGAATGEGSRPALEKAVALLVEEHEAKGTLRRGPVDLERPPPAPEPLAFPGKVAASADGRLLAIADTGHDRVLVATVDGVVLEAHTGYRHPQGVRFDGERVVVCDTGADRVVRTGAQVLADGIASPWDVVADAGGAWVVAEAGRHRLLRLRPGELRARVAAGTGEEGLEDDRADRCRLAQPSGVARTPEGIVFVDAESSALRLLVPDRAGGRVATLVGTGLFDWGDDDGPPEVARMQHPLGVAAHPGGGPVYVADTFNSALRVWDGTSLRTLPVAGLAQPGGLDVLADGRLVVADTDNHRVVVVDPGTGAVDAVELDETWLHADDGPPLALRPGQAAVVPVGFTLVDESLDRSGPPPVRVVVEARPPHLLAGGPGRWELAEAEGAVEVRAGAPGAGMLLVEVAAATCLGDRGAVRVQRRRHRLDVAAGR